MAVAERLLGTDMAHYALIDENNIVVSIIRGVDETDTQIDTDGTVVGGSTEAWEKFYESQPWHAGLTCKRTSYNNNIRKTYAIVGAQYLPEQDIFLKLKPHEKYVLNENYDWVPPTPMPTEDISPQNWYWNPTTEDWEKVTPVPETE